MLPSLPHLCSSSGVGNGYFEYIQRRMLTVYNTPPRAALPTTAQCILMFFEGIRTIPGEVRMMLRIYRRGRPNIVEIIFFVIKVSRGRVR